MALLVVLGKFHGKIFCHLHWHCEKNRFDLRHTQHLVGLKDILQATFLEGDFCRCHDVLPCDSLVTREIHPASMQDGWKISFFPPPGGSVSYQSFGYQSGPYHSCEGEGKLLAANMFY